MGRPSKSQSEKKDELGTLTLDTCKDIPAAATTGGGCISPRCREAAQGVGQGAAALGS